MDVKNRSIRIKNLPAGTQEGLLQQALEKRAIVKRVEIYAEAREAIVELENAVVSLFILTFVHHSLIVPK